MTTRRLLVFGLLAGLLAMAAGGWLLWPRTHTVITRENAAKIQVGMTLAEVVAILGRPRYEETGPTAADVDPVELARLHKRIAAPTFWVYRRGWYSDRMTVVMSFDPKERTRVTEVVSYPVHRVHDSPLDMLRRWMCPPDYED